MSLWRQPCTVPHPSGASLAVSHGIERRQLCGVPLAPCPSLPQMTRCSLSSHAASSWSLFQGTRLPCTTGPWHVFLSPLGALFPQQPILGLKTHGALRFHAPTGTTSSNSPAPAVPGSAPLCSAPLRASLLSTPPALPGWYTSSVVCRLPCLWLLLLECQPCRSDIRRLCLLFVAPPSVWSTARAQSVGAGIK